jgi:hypothetical protein
MSRVVSHPNRKCTAWSHFAFAIKDGGLNRHGIYRPNAVFIFFPATTLTMHRYV